VFSLDDNTDATRLQDVLDRTRNLRCQLLLNLKSTAKTFDDAGQLGDANHAALGQIAHMRSTNDRQHVMLAAAYDTNIPQHDEFVVAADLLERTLQERARIDAITREQFGIGSCDSGRRISQPLAFRIIAGPADERPDGTFGFAARRSSG
jgi:hypothetical protein